MDIIGKSDPKLSYEELRKQNLKLKNQIKDIQGELNSEKVKAVESEKKYEEFYKNAPLPYHSLDQDGYFVDVNPAWLLVMGYAFGEIIGKYYGDFLHPDWKVHFKNKFPIFKQSGHVHTSFKIRHKNGHYLDIDLNGKILYNFDGSFKQTNCVFQDITEKKGIELELKEQAVFVNQNPAPVFCISYDGKIQSFNKAASNISSNFKIGTSIDKIIEDFSGSFLKNIQEKTQFQFEKLLGLRTFLFTIKNDIDTKKIYFFGSDISEKKNQELELKEAINSEEEISERLELAMQITHDGPWDWDLKTNEIYYSSRWKEILGYLPNELPNDFTVWEKLTHPEDVKISWELLHKHIAGELDKFEIELQMQHKNGGWIDILSRAHAIFNEEGEAVRVVGTHIDITEEKKIRQKLVDSEKRFRELTEHLPSGVAVYRAVNEGDDFEFIDYNSAAEKITNISKEKVVGNTLLECFPKMKVSPLFKALCKVHKTGTEIHIDPFYYKDETREGWRENSIYKLPNGEIVAIFKDVTELKLTQEILKKKNERLQTAMLLAEQNEQRFKVLYDNSPDMYVSVSPENLKIVLCNDTFLSKTGYSRTEIIGASIFKVYHDDAIEEARKTSEIFKEKGSISNKELIIRKKNGDKIDVSLNITAIRDANGKVLYSMSSWRDISSRIKLREKQLRDRKLLNETGRLAKIGGWELNVETMTGYFSQETKHIYGLPLNAEPPELSDGWKYYSKESQEELQKLVEDAIGTGKPYNFEAPFFNKKGEQLWVKTMGLAEKMNGKVVRLYGTIQDITEQKKHEKELIAAKKQAEKSDKLKSAFLANMSHEIRTPMNGILGFTELLQGANLSVENQTDYIGIIQKSGERLLSTVNDIIEISKIESAEINVAKSEVDVIAFLDTLVSFFKAEAEKKNLQIIIQNNIDQDYLSITTDKTKLGSILTNLIKNAIKYTNAGTIKVGFEIKDEQILFSCQDSGVGIPKDRQEAIFNRFEQADIEDKLAQEGSGLGLAIVKSYVKMLGGKIWLESEEGKGSIFYFSLPYDSATQNELNSLQNEKSSEFDMKNIKVLIVEDDEYSSMHLSAVLNGITKNIISVKNGLEAVETCKTDSSIDIILMDIKMPKMDGFEATQKIREFNKDVVIIAQTAFAFEEDKQNALLAGCNDYISKPIKKDKLMELIGKYL